MIYQGSSRLTREMHNSEITDLDETFQIRVFKDGDDDGEVKKF